MDKVTASSTCSLVNSLLFDPFYFFYGQTGAHFCPFLFSSESGFLHKVVLLAKGPHIIEEIQTFIQPQTVKNILLSKSKVLKQYFFPLSLLVFLHS